ncbi:MAG: OPT family small oligopeptide transporter [Linnemannia gamsii]|nr:MAG: OPT family small oligopeptide transporter [Linnemannia gamsii]
MDDHARTGAGPPGAGGGGTTPTRTRIAPGTVVQRRSTDNTYVQDSTVSDDYYEYDEKSGTKGQGRDEAEAGSFVYSGPGGVGASSSYSESSRSRFNSSDISADKFDEKGGGVGGGGGRGGDVESQISSVDSEDNSPIEEVRAIVPVTDDPSMPTNTFRMWFLALFFTLLVSFVNQFFYLRQNPVSITYTVVSLITLPLGKFLARVLPSTQFRLFGPLGGPRVSLNPGPFNIKEHALIGTAVACCSGTAYAVDIVILQKKYYEDDQGFIAGFMLVLTTQVTGFSLAGVLRKFLVRPASMIWPANLVTVALFRTLHESSEENDDDDSNQAHVEGQGDGDQGHEMRSGQGLESRVLDTIRKNRRKTTRLQYFAYVSLGSFIYYWFPNYIFPTLTAFSILCWINPKNVILSQLTGSNGLGIGTISFDWATSTSALAPLVTPWWAQVNILVGFVIVAWIIAPIAYYSNLWNSKNYPILTAGLFKEDGTPYDKAMVMTNNVLDPVKYEAYGPLRMDSFFALTYGIGFAGLTATLTHVALYHGKEIRDQWKAVIAMKDHDIHSRMMMKYKEVPQWWYATLFLISLAMSIFCVEKWHYLPWYYLLVSLAIAFIFALPVGIVQAVTNQQPGLNVITEYVIGYLMPGHPIANVTFKAYGYITNVQALQFTQDLKLGHYMKIPPRIMFWVQVISSVIAGIVNLATTDWLLKVQPNICTKAGYPWTCRNTNTFYSASVIWGVIGPGRMFGLGTQYSIIQWGFVIGAFLPLPVWWLCRRYPRVKFLQKIHFPVLLAATSNMPPAQAYFYPNGIFLGFIFMWYIRRYHNAWWKRYNYVTSAAMDTGVALSGLVCYFLLQSWDKNFFEWWGASDVIDHCPLAETNFFGQ